MAIIARGPLENPVHWAVHDPETDDPDLERLMACEHMILMDLFAPEQRRGRAYQRLFRAFVQTSQLFPHEELRVAWRREAMVHARA